MSAIDGDYYKYATTMQAAYAVFSEVPDDFG